MSPGPTFAILPVKALADAKRRLAPVLAPAERARLVVTMLEDILALLAASQAIDRVVVVTSDAQVTGLARHHGAHVIGEDMPCDLNAAIRCGLAYARAQGATRALVLPADIPLTTREELATVLEAAPQSSKPHAVIVPSSDSSGTGALLLSPPDALQPEFGPDSFVRHVAQAVALGLDFRVLRLPGLAADIDEPRDLARLSGERYAFLSAGHARPEHDA